MEQGTGSRELRNREGRTVKRAPGQRKPREQGNAEQCAGNRGTGSQGYPKGVSGSSEGGAGDFKMSFRKLRTFGLNVR